jgi:hypothetical protein
VSIERRSSPLLRNRITHYCAYNIPPLYSILSQFNPVYIFTMYFTVYSQIFTCASQIVLSLKLSKQTSFSGACYMSAPPYSSWYYLPHTTIERVQCRFMYLVINSDTVYGEMYNSHVQEGGRNTENNKSTWLNL